ncbi:hypothetical protein PVAP13_9NG011502 [Panicum virgatum]|uniref:Uncharacterized protein n=1 Tax=Panicum virgatum TaxID=38727 RepID=A0A8T0MBH4_PANVG|nr:hypothetical protein PVAP13_9NG011502 [Panicum virgatum]
MLAHLAVASAHARRLPSACQPVTSAPPRSGWPPPPCRAGRVGEDVSPAMAAGREACARRAAWVGGAGGSWAAPAARARAPATPLRPSQPPYSGRAGRRGRPRHRAGRCVQDHPAPPRVGPPRAGPTLSLPEGGREPEAGREPAAAAAVPVSPAAVPWPRHRRPAGPPARRRAAADLRPASSEASEPRPPSSRSVSSEAVVPRARAAVVSRAPPPPSRARRRRRRPARARAATADAEAVDEVERARPAPTPARRPAAGTALRRSRQRRRLEEPRPLDGDGAGSCAPGSGPIGGGLSSWGALQDTGGGLERASRGRPGRRSRGCRRWREAPGREAGLLDVGERKGERGKRD